MTSFSITGRLPDFSLWEKIADKRIPLDFTLELTARCNNNCTHCYINLPAGDQQARRDELTLAEISDIADQAINLGSLWCLITGGEPLLREDFKDIYISLKKKGLLVSIFTNACLVTEEHIELFKKYPPRDIEVTVYGITEVTYERVTRCKGSYAAFRRGLDLLLQNGFKVRLKTVALRSNVDELQSIADFCRANTMDFYRFDPFLNLRHDGNPARNVEILEERLSPSEIVAIEREDNPRASELEDKCDDFIIPEFLERKSDYLFHCGAGNKSFVVNYEGIFRLCSSVIIPQCTFNLRNGTLTEAWNELIPKVRDMHSTNPAFIERCRRCPIVNLCMWCPGNAHLETGEMDGYSQYFCDVAHARAAAIQERVRLKKENQTP